ncbi:MAG: molybdopterin-dependent oxidoreductase [Dehalococcoidia bacterium]
MTQQLTITIDGKEVKARPGQTILQAALDNGIYIPYLCYFPGMKPWGACRMCLVEIEGARGTPASCTTPVADKMVVKTTTPLLHSLRQGILELLLSEHPHGCLTCHRIELCGPTDICLRHIRVTDRCVVCPKNERCELKDTVRFVGVPMETPLPYNYRNLPMEVRDPFYDRDYNLCIVCARCVRACDELRGDSAICMVERSGKVLVGTSRGTSLLESGCEFCGACIDVCPVGALVERQWKWEKAATTAFTTCPNCPVGCQMKVEVDKRGRLIRAIGDWNAHNGGMLCYKGKFGLEFVNASSPLRKPLLRKDGHLQEVSWEEALDYTAKRLANYKGSYAVLLGLRATNEDAYLAQKFARLAMASNAIDACYDTRPFLLSPLREALGIHAPTGSLTALKNARCFLVVNSNITEEHNVGAVPVKQAVKAGTARLIVIDSREVELTRYAHLWLRPLPGTEHLVLGAMVRLLLEEGLTQKEHLDQVEGMDALRQHIADFALDHIPQVSGVPLESLRRAVRLLAQHRPTAFLYALDNLPPAQGEMASCAVVDMALLTGNEGWLFPLPPGTNRQGLLDMGALAGYLPGHAPLGDPSARQRLAEAWGAEVPQAPALDFSGVLAGVASKRVRAVQVVGNSPGVDAPAVHTLASAGFLVVHDHILSPLARMADVVFPSATFAQRDGSYTSLERRIQRLRAAVPLRGEERPDWWVFASLAQGMGAKGFTYASWEEVWQEITALVPAYAGVGVEGGVQWPCTPQRKRLLSLSILPIADIRTDEFPLALAMGRVLLQDGRHMQVVQRGRLNTIQREEVVEVHPEDARRLGLANGTVVDVVTPQGRQRARLKTTGTVPGLVSVTALFGQLAVQLASSESPDPMLAVPPLSVLPARLEAVE